NDYDAFVRIFNADGSARSGQITVHDPALSGQNNTAISSLSDGNFIVSWTNTVDHGVWGPNNTEISARIFNPEGQAITDVITVNQHLTGFQDQTDVTSLANGNFIITWQSQDPNVDGDNYGVSARIYDAAGTPLSNEFTLNTTNISGAQQTPEITSLTTGGFVAVFSSTDGLFARVFDANGQALTDEFKVDSRNSYFNSPNVVGLEDGGFAV
ncbi:hypothetical protein O4H49_20535, partial [Kiloniella laminariae]